jgi:hypothetical protein
MDLLVKYKESQSSLNSSQLGIKMRLLTMFLPFTIYTVIDSFLKLNERTWNSIVVGVNGASIEIVFSQRNSYNR